MDITHLSIQDLGQGYKNGDYTVADVIAEYTKNIKESNSQTTYSET